MPKLKLLKKKDEKSVNNASKKGLKNVIDLLIKSNLGLLK